MNQADKQLLIKMIEHQITMTDNSYRTMEGIDEKALQEIKQWRKLIKVLEEISVSPPVERIQHTTTIDGIPVKVIAHIGFVSIATGFYAEKKCQAFYAFGANNKVLDEIYFTDKFVKGE